MRIGMITVLALCLAGLASPVGVAHASDDPAARGEQHSSPKARYDDIVVKIETANPTRPVLPCPPEEAAGYAAFIVAERDAVPADKEFLASLKGGKLEGVSDKQLDTLIYRRGYMLERQLEKKLSDLHGEVDYYLRKKKEYMEYIRSVDPNDEYKQKNMVLKEGAMEKEFGYFTETAEAIEISRAFYEALGESGPDHDAIAAELATTRAHFDKIAANALDSVKMPPDIGNAELTAIAREVLAKDKYGVSPIKALSVVRGLTHERKATVDTRKGHLVVYDYQWDEFTVATAEEVAPGSYFIHWNTLKRFTSGAPTTPTEVWVLGERFQSSRIPAKNL